LQVHHQSQQYVFFHFSVLLTVVRLKFRSANWILYQQYAFYHFLAAETWKLRNRFTPHHISSFSLAVLKPVQAGLVSLKKKKCHHVAICC
jgi:hypothetical protein